MVLGMAATALTGDSAGRTEAGDPVPGKPLAIPVGHRPERSPKF